MRASALLILPLLVGSTLADIVLVTSPPKIQNKSLIFKGSLLLEKLYPPFYPDESGKNFTSFINFNLIKRSVQRDQQSELNMDQKLNVNNKTFAEKIKKNKSAYQANISSIRGDVVLKKDVNLSEISYRRIDLTKNLINNTLNTHLRETRSERSENSDFYDILRYQSTLSDESSDSIDFSALSQVFRNLNDSSKAKLEIENYVLSRNDTLKSLGSIDVIVPSLDGMALFPRPGDHNFSRIDGRHSARNRTASQILGRTDAPMLNYIFDTYSTLNKHLHRNDRFGGPRFESPGSTVTVDTEADANLDCRVTSLQDKLVLWVRRKPGYDKLEILTIGQQTYTADPRFSVEYLVPSTWRLVLRSAIPSDSGAYECQLSTHPPLISRHQLIVHAPVVEIVEADGDKYYERNSTLELSCRIRHLPTSAVNWFHQTRILNDDTLRGGISVKTETVPNGADSTLQVARLTATDGGKYTCTVREGLQASINIHVLNGESLAELQQTAGTSPHLPASSVIFLVISFWTSLLQDQIFRDTVISYPKPARTVTKLYLR